MINAKVVADSKNEFGNRITTMVVTFPRIILAEFNAHRMFSRNSASSRAIPFEKMVKSIQENPFIPIAWQKDHKGMQGIEYFTDPNDIQHLINNHLDARDYAIYRAHAASTKGLTKQICNRYLEPFMWHTVIVTATEWENFFALRCPQYNAQFTWETETKVFRSKKDVINHWKKQFDKDSEAGIVEEQRIGQPRYYDELTWLKINKGQAEIHMMALAETMWDAYSESIPKQLQAGDWHIPYERNIDETKLQLEYLDCINKRGDSPALDLSKFRYAGEEAKVKIASMMAARTSYTIIGEEGKEWSYDKYIQKHDELVAANPLHASPIEHCAKAMNKYYCENYPSNSWSGNFRGFIQYRKMFKNENITI